MKKGVDHALFRRVVVDNITGEVVKDDLTWQRPGYGVKELRRRATAKKAAKQSRKRNR